MKYLPIKAYKKAQDATLTRHPPLFSLHDPGIQAVESSKAGLGENEEWLGVLHQRLAAPVAGQHRWELDLGHRGKGMAEPETCC